LLETYSPMLPALFIVSQVEVVPFGEPAPVGHLDPVQAEYGEQYAGLHIGVEKASGGKCARCWNYSTHVGENADYPTVCERCVAALAEIENGGNGGVPVGSGKP
jgi:isoleucyl-tRNA synthetase